MPIQQIKLVLEDGSVFPGFSFGADRSVSGEVVFNTGMTGYPESMTDPSYRGQILVFTYPLIGNYGVPPQTEKDGMKSFFESDEIHCSGIVISDYSFKHNHYHAEQSLASWMSSQGIPGIYGIDTRELTKKLRECGTMAGKIVTGKDIPFRDISKDNLVAEVSIKQPITYSRPDAKATIVAIDCGIKSSIIRSFLSRSAKVIRVPWDYDFTDLEYDGLFISNGPGDPQQCTQTIQNIRKAMAKGKPIMGICLGNQLLARAAGAKTYKLKYGHRSQNQPCIDCATKRCYITSQNHGYAVDSDSLPAGWEPSFINANDGTNEGIRHIKDPFFSVQFHPEAAPGPTDTGFLFDTFLEMIR